MTQDWWRQLRSEDPRERAEAIKEIAVSGNEQYLDVLKNVVENDPDPRIQDYARKAARHLYTSLQEKEQSQPPAKERADDGAPLTPPPAKEVSRADREAAQSKLQRAFSLHTANQTKKALKVYGQALDLYPGLEKEPFARSLAGELTGKTPEEALAIYKDPLKRQELFSGSPPKTSPSLDDGEDLGPPEERTVVDLFQIWLRFFSLDEDFLRRERRQANGEDTLLGVLVHTIAAVAKFLINGFVQFQQLIPMINQQIPQLNMDLGLLFLGILIGTAILTPISFYLTAGLQFLGARLVGGQGSFGVHAYLMSLIQVPITVLGGVVSLTALIPVVGLISGLLGFSLSIFSLILTVRVIKAAHDLTSGRAVVALIVLPIALSFLGGCLLLVTGTALGSLLSLGG